MDSYVLIIVAVMARGFVSGLVADSQMMQIQMQEDPERLITDRQPSQDCHTAVDGDECYTEVVWAKKNGLREYPKVYENLTNDSSFEDFQMVLHRLPRLSHVCGRPCVASPSAARMPQHNASGVRTQSDVMTVWPTLHPTTSPTPSPIPSMAEVLASDPPDFYEQKGTNCDCDITPPAGFPLTSGPGKTGDYVYQYWAGSKNNPEMCADACSDDPTCMSFGFYTSDSTVVSWRGLCFLYDAPCPDGDGKDPSTTCPHPVGPDEFVVNYNRLPTPAPTPLPTPAVLPCTSLDGSAPSSFYPCKCGQDTICPTSNICTLAPGAVEGACAVPHTIKVEWPTGTSVEAEGGLSCPQPYLGSLYYSHYADAVTGAPAFKNDYGIYLYWDRYCAGTLPAGTASTPRWILDNQEPVLTEETNLDQEPECAYIGAHNATEREGPPFGTTVWDVNCQGTMSTLNVTITFAPLGLPTPAPTLQPGADCACQIPCGFFSTVDIDNDGCIFEFEANMHDMLKGKHSAMDADGNGCVSKEECEAWDPGFDVFPFPIPNPSECDHGYYFPKQSSVCIRCEPQWHPASGTPRPERDFGETRRRRSDECTLCPPGREDVGDYDDCLGGIYLTQAAEIDDTKLHINRDYLESGITLTIRAGITIATRNPDYYERGIIVGKVGFADSADSAARLAYNSNASEQYVVLDHPLVQPFYKFDAITPACNNLEGTTVEDGDNYPCGCGREICEKTYACWETCVGPQATRGITQISGAPAGISYGDSGCCLGPMASPLPTPVPTVSAKGDPHLVNLQGEHFDVNHAGDFTLLRLPQAANKPAEVLLQATIRPEHGKPCTTYITEVEFSGRWFGNKSVQVRSYLRAHAKNETDKFLGARVLEGGVEAPWQSMTEWAKALTAKEDSLVLSSPGAKSGFEVSLSKQSWSTKKGGKGGAPTMAGQFAITIRSNGQHQDDATRIVVRQDVPKQEHLNLAVRKLGHLGRLDVGGLLGFDSHPESLEEVSRECERHRMGLDHKGPKFEPTWKTRWNKIKADRDAHKKYSHSDDSMNDNEAAANLIGKSLMCACSSREHHAESETGAENEEDGEDTGVIVEYQKARFAEASWD